VSTAQRYTYPHTIDNGGGERLTFSRPVPGRNGDRIVGENLVRPGGGPPMHVHYHQEEVFTVIQGRLGYQTLGAPELFAAPGETVTFKRGVPHRFWNPGPEDLRCSGVVEPADNLEYFLTEVFDSMKRNGGKQPDPFDAAFLLTRYRNENAMLAIPWAVQTFVFPVLLVVGKLLGRYRRYADAPESLHAGR
jgi:mannose-6-phosphate isomerase-like protein (cupin superfamily)